MMVIISSLLKGLSALSQWFQNKQLIDAGEATAERDAMSKVIKKVSDANKINNRDDNRDTVLARMQERNNK